MLGKSFTIACLLVLMGVVCGQEPTDPTSFNWRIYHSTRLKDYVDFQSEEWRSLPASTRRQLRQIPEDEMNSMSTQELIEAYIDCRPARFYFATNTLEMYYLSVFSQFNGARELMKRENLAEELITYYSNMNPADTTNSNAGIPMPYQIVILEYLIGNPATLESFSTTQIRRIIAELVTKQHQIVSLSGSSFLQSNIYALARAIGWFGGETSNELHQVNNLDFILRTGLLPDDTNINKIMEIANNISRL